MELPGLDRLMSLSGRCAVVTGGAQGFGYAIARRLAEAGALVVIADRDAAGGESAAARLIELGFEAAAHPVDISDPASVEALVDSASLHTGRLDILVNNAGIFSNYYFAQMPAAEFQATIDVNVSGTFHCTQAVVRRMMEDGAGGTILNVASVDAFRPSAEGLVHYTTSKHAIAGLTRSLAMELAPSGIRVNAVCPGASMTEGAIALVTAGAPEGIDVEAQWDGIKDRTPLGRLCDPDDVARAAVYLVSDMAEFVTGAFLVVDGGILIQPLEGYVDSSPD